MSVTDVGEPSLVRTAALEIAQGTVLAGRYQVEAVIGRGGSGIVLRAFDRVAQVAVAVKILKPDLAADPHWIERFSRELRLARQIQHPNVCRVFDIGQADGHWFITMELATAGTLRDQLPKDGAVRPLEARLQDIRAVIAGVAAIHEAGIVHRDVKPDNFLRMQDGRLVLSDFGLATNPAENPMVSIMVGTPFYMAPEAALGEVATVRSDVWGAGVVIHEILLGRRPDRGAGGRVKNVDAPRGLGPIERALLRVCEACLEEDPESRPADAAALNLLVERALAAPTRFSFKGRRRTGRAPRVVWGVTLAVTLAVVAILGRRLWQPATAIVSAPRNEPGPITTSGTPRDWTKSSTLFATFEDTVHCFSMLPDGETARVVWGRPRRAEDVVISTGKHSPAPLLPVTYEVDCPQLSPKGDTLLFTKRSAGASLEIVRSGPLGERPTSLTPGAEPLWLPTGEEFLFNVNASHVGVFSLPTMTSSLLLGGRDQAVQAIYRKAVSPRGDFVAVVYHRDTVHRLLEIHSLPDLRTAAVWRLPSSIQGVDFHGDLITLTNVSAPGTLDLLDWRRGVSQRTGSLTGSVVESIAPIANGVQALLSSTKSSDVWLSGGEAAPRQLTHDGRNYGASWSPNGSVLVSRQLAENRYAIFLYDGQGHAKQVTEGPSDVTPSFSNDGSAWTYADYHRNAIVLCENGVCRTVRNEQLAGRPVVSPDRQHIAYFDQGGNNHLSVIERDGSAKRDLGPSAKECAPVWTSATSLWAYSGTELDHRWTEIDLPTGKRTGRTKAAFEWDSATAPCGAVGEGRESPFYQHARIVPRERWEARLAQNVLGAN